MPEEMTPENTDVNTENTDVDTDKIDRVVKVFQALSPEEQQRTYEVIGGMMEPVEEVPEGELAEEEASPFENLQTRLMGIEE